MITFSRSRPYKKNDQCHVEQKNGYIIRRTVGYDRFEGIDAWNSLMKLYRVLRLYVNFFQPSGKLLRKVRTGSRVRKIYDKAKTPYQRLIESKELSEEKRRKLTVLYETLDPVALFEELGRLQQKLLYFAEEEVCAVDNVVSRPVLKGTQQQDFPAARLHSLKPSPKFKRAYRTRVAHTWRTREDPLEGVSELARRLFDEDPGITSTALMRKLQESNPGKLKGGELKTLQRRLSAWRKEKLNAHPETPPRGSAYDPMVCRQTLSFSNPLAITIT